MANKYLDESGLSYFWNKLKTIFAGKVDKSGDQMTGNLDILSQNITRGEAISSGSGKYPGGFSIYDKNGDSPALAYFQPTQTNYGAQREGIQFGTGRSVNGSDVWNNIELSISSTGAQSVSVSNASAWRSALGLSSYVSGVKGNAESSYRTGQVNVTPANIGAYTKDEVDAELTNKQDTLVSGTNIKTVNGNSLLGSGDLTISGGSSSNVIDMVYPVGSIYMSTNSVSPSTLFGGTWEQIKDTFLLSAGDTYSAGTTGGEAEHTLTIDEMPSHTHTMALATSNASSANYARMGYQGETNRGATGPKGGGQAHNNMPPYLPVYMWKRTA